VHVAIVGARSRANVERSLAAADIELTGPDVAEITRIAADGVQVEGASPEGVA
jgi:aryl-alcohol dehydrogenase-like predicted oxidoreductase